MPQVRIRHATVTIGRIALGSNLPLGKLLPAEIVGRAIRDLRDLPGELEAESAVYATPCMPAGAGPDYANAVVRVATPLGPHDLMEALHDIEARYERTRKQRWAARTLDLDLLDWGGAVLPDPETWAAWAELPGDLQITRTPDRLVLPHPRLQSRAFVLVPLAEIDPTWRHPALGRTASEMRDALPPDQLAAIRPLAASQSLANPGPER